jgi:hypothetical protein
VAILVIISLWVRNGVKCRSTVKNLSTTNCNKNVSYSLNAIMFL